MVFTSILAPWPRSAFTKERHFPGEIRTSRMTQWVRRKGELERIEQWALKFGDGDSSGQGGGILGRGGTLLRTGAGEGQVVVDAEVCFPGPSTGRTHCLSC